MGRWSSILECERVELVSSKITSNPKPLEAIFVSVRYTFQVSNKFLNLFTPTSTSLTDLIEQEVSLEFIFQTVRKKATKNRQKNHLFYDQSTFNIIKVKRDEKEEEGREEFGQCEWIFKLR